MARRVQPADLGRIRTYPLARRSNKVAGEMLGRPADLDEPLWRFLESLPEVLGVRSLRGLARAIAAARAAGRPVIWAMGAHPIKVGVGPVLIDMMRRGTITALVLNGAGAIHDWEMAAIAETSEDVAAGLGDGMFGMVSETGRAINAAAVAAAGERSGLGEVLGRQIAESDLPHRELSLLATAHRLELPATVHVTLGADTVHMHPSADGAAIGAATFTDFRRLATLVAGLEGGVWINCGSAVQLPEVFLKALTVARNLGNAVAPITTANLDMQRHYRVEQNVLDRPTRRGGASFNLIGHHEINVPLLAAAVALARREG
jgi:hypothetical protein